MLFNLGDRITEKQASRSRGWSLKNPARKTEKIASKNQSSGTLDFVDWTELSQLPASDLFHGGGLHLVGSRVNGTAGARTRRGLSDRLHCLAALRLLSDYENGDQSDRNAHAHSNCQAVIEDQGF